MSNLSAVNNKVLLVWEDKHNSGKLTHKVFPTVIEAEEFTTEEDFCPDGDWCKYLILSGTFAIITGNVDKT